MICIDGPAGAGKSTLSEAVAAQSRDQGVTVHVVHLDDTYDGWDQSLFKLGGRLRNYLVGPLASGHVGQYRRFDWSAGEFTDWVRVPAVDLLILEGVGSGHWQIASRRATLVWVDADPKLCLARGLARDGDALRPQWLAWKEREGAYFSALGIQEEADIRVVTTNAR